MAETVDTMESVLGSGAGGPLSAPSPWIQYPGYLYYAGGLVVGSPAGGNKGSGTLNLTGLFINGVAVNVAAYLPLTGGTLSGPLTLPGNPTLPLHATPKQYIDSLITSVNAQFANFLPIAGGALTGPLSTSSTITLSGAPVAPLQAATKQYVDDALSGLISVPDAPSDGTNYGRLNHTWSGLYDPGTY